MQTSASVRSIRSMPFCWIHKALFDLGLSWKGIITYTALAYEFSSEQAREVPLKRLATIVSVSEDTIRRGLKELVENKAIIVKVKYIKKNGKRQQLPNEYTLIDLAITDQHPI